MSLGTSSEHYDSDRTHHSRHGEFALLAPTKDVDSAKPVCLADESMPVRQNPTTHNITSLIYFVDRAVPFSDLSTSESGCHKIVEERLKNPTELLNDLIDRYGGVAVDLMIVLHKQSLVTPILKLMSEIETHPELFSRSQLTIIPHIFRDPKIFEWVAEKPFTRLPRIKIAG